jgi:hypothetical protein
LRQPDAPLAPLTAEELDAMEVDARGCVPGDCPTIDLPTQIRLVAEVRRLREELAELHRAEEVNFRKMLAMRGEVAPSLVHLADVEYSLREACADAGVEFPEGLHFGDVIEKHLMRNVLGRIEELEAEVARLRPPAGVSYGVTAMLPSVLGERVRVLPACPVCQQTDPSGMTVSGGAFPLRVTHRSTGAVCEALECPVCRRGQVRPWGETPCYVEHLDGTVCRYIPAERP